MAFGTLPSRGRRIRGRSKFQSLFFWNGLWDEAPHQRHRQAHPEVSILVFLEWPLGQAPRQRLGRGNSSFNPCFSGMAFGTRSATRRHEAGGPVSILVFLEWPLGRAPLRKRLAELESFNPCFSGMAFGTILVSWPPLKHHFCFNPCFSGMAFGTRRLHRRGRAGGGVSILVFLEWPLGLMRLIHTGDIHFRFQSLFFWNGLWDSTGQVMIGKDLEGFNPCFSGMAFGTDSGSWM